MKVDVLLPAIAALSACALTGFYTRVLSSRGRLQRPNHRSMHGVPVPSGAGVIIIAIALLLWPASQDFSMAPLHLLALSAVAALSGLSWIDDHYQLSPGFRLTAHTVAVGLLLVSLPSDARVLDAIPLAAERMCVGIAWLWFINLFNFMDGIDGIAGTEAIAIAVGFVAVLTVTGIHPPLSDLAVIVAAASAGYLVWNWHPAKVFMGDAGSIPLGFLMGWLMLDLAFRGFWAAAAILPLYFVADATLTLLGGVWAGRKPWRPHRNHFYQRAVLGGATPPFIVRRVLVLDALLVVLALLSIRFPAGGLLAAIAVVAGFLFSLERLARHRLNADAKRQQSPPSKNGRGAGT